MSHDHHQNDPPKPLLIGAALLMIGSLLIAYFGKGSQFSAELMPETRFAEIKTQITDLAVATGEMIMVDRDQGSVEDQLDNLALDAKTAIPKGMEVVTIPAAPAPPPQTPAAAPTTPEADDSGADARAHAAIHHAGDRAIRHARRSAGDLSRAP